jgi:hypothetical protein
MIKHLKNWLRKLFVRKRCLNCKHSTFLAPGSFILYCKGNPFNKVGKDDLCESWEAE